jgi:hypothetical protein
MCALGARLIPYGNTLPSTQPEAREDGGHRLMSKVGKQLGERIYELHKTR